MDADYTFISRRVIADGELYQAADPVTVKVFARGIDEAVKKAKKLVESKDTLLCIQNIEERN